MNARIRGLVAVLVFGPALNALAEENHKMEAMTHTQAAIEQGNQGHANALAQHAEMALKHAEAAEMNQPNAHMKQGITHLQTAIDEGHKDQAELGTRQAIQALEHIQQSP